MPLRFEPNAGQFAPSVRYVARAEGLTLALADEGPTLYLHSIDQTAAKSVTAGKATPGRIEPEKPRARTRQSDPIITRALRMRVANARPRAELAASDELASKSNYYLGADPRSWRTNVANFGQVKYREVLPGIDAIYHGDGRKLEYDFVVAPGASPDAIAIDFEGADAIERNAAGELLVAIADRTLVQHRPVVYQDIDGVRRSVDGEFRLLGTRRVGFEIGAYDRSRPLVIDPTVVFTRYFGDADKPDTAFDLAVLSTGQIAIVGATKSTGLPSTANAYQPAYHAATDSGLCANDDIRPCANTDGFLTVLNAAGTGVAYSTYFGGECDDIMHDVVIGASDTIFVGGESGLIVSTGGCWTNHVPVTATLDPEGITNDFVPLPPSWDYRKSGGILAKFTASGTLIFAEIVGSVESMALDAAGDVYLASNGASVGKVAGDGSRWLGGRTLGGSSRQSSTDIALDASGNPVIVGWTSSSDFQTVSPYQATKKTLPNTTAPVPDLFVAKLSANLSTIIFSTYLGGTDNDTWGESSNPGHSGPSVALDASGNIYIVGSTKSTDYPTASAYQSAFGGGETDAVVTKMSADGSALVYSTYLGGTARDFGHDIAVDADGRAYVVGSTDSPNFPLVDATKSTLAGRDGFVSVLSPSGAALSFSSYFGGSDNDSLYAVGLTSNRRVAVAGGCDRRTVVADRLGASILADGDACVALLSLCDDGAGTCDEPDNQLLVLSSTFTGARGPCTNGGTEIVVGVDVDNSGTLTGAEISSTSYACNAAEHAIAFASTVLVADPGVCPSGGFRLQFGIDDNDNDSLQPGEVDTTHTLCHGSGSLVNVSAVVPDPGTCPTGGSLVAFGIDLDGDTTLDAGELLASQRVCNGLSMLARSSSLAAGVCPNGGVRIDLGVDDDGDATLDAAEIDATQNVCAGSGSLIAMATLAPDASVCPGGGVRVSTGADADGDGELAGAEATDTANICHGRSSLTRSTPLAADPAQCPSGGNRLDTGLDDDGDEVLSDAEVDSSLLACNGTSSAVRSTVLAAGSATCPAGGVLVESGIDADSDGSLADSEVQHANPVCGMPAALVESEALSAGEDCEHGGIRVNTGRDDGQPSGTAGDGVLQPGEIESSHDLCQPDAPVGDDDSGVDGGSGDVEPARVDVTCSLAPGAGRSASLGWMLLGLAFVLLRRRRSVRRTR